MAKTSGKMAAKQAAARKKQKKLAKTPVKSAEPVTIIGTVKRLPSVWQITKDASLTLWTHKKLFLTITLVYGLLTLVLVRGLSGGTNVADLKHQLSQVFTGHFGALASSLSILVLLVGSAGNSSNNTAGAYQLFLALTASLALIWALRQVLAGSRVRARDAYYRGMYPLIPFILVLLVCGLQLLPLVIGSTIYSLVISNNIAVHVVEKVLWGGLFGGLAFITIYLLSSSLFALYIVTLPDMTPLKSLRSARQLVRGRRWQVLRKLLCLPLVLLVITVIIMVPIILVISPLAQWVFFLLTMLALAAVHAYMYTLYRELLSD